MKDYPNKLSTEHYKGVRDFYPEDMFVQNYIFGIMSQTAESFGYEEYGASVLEESSLYEAKSGEEIVSKQTYNFTDRGGRSVTLRPEMTPTVARMVAGKRRELSFPLRLYSIPNLFRYERPQRGRLREHFQLNVDLFGIEDLSADIEIIHIAHAVMKNFGAKSSQFEIRVGSRKLFDRVCKYYGLSENEIKGVSYATDRRNKIEKGEFMGLLKEALLKKPEVADILFQFITKNDFVFLPDTLKDSDEVKELEELQTRLGKLGIKNIKIDVSVVRGFDYYTGIVFEVFDTHPQNNRSLFGGGRYDDLLDIFDAPHTPTVGFGMGDVTIKDFMETYKLMPSFESMTDLYICTLDKSLYDTVEEIACYLRESGLNVAVDYSGKKVGDQIKTADKKKIPYIMCIGENEIKNKVFAVKHLKDGGERELALQNIAEHILGHSSP